MQSSGVTYLPPVVALSIGTLLGGEPLRPLDVIAMSAILGGVYVMLGFRAGGTPKALRAGLRKRPFSDYARRMKSQTAMGR